MTTAPSIGLWPPAREDHGVSHGAIRGWYVQFRVALGDRHLAAVFAEGLGSVFPRASVNSIGESVWVDMRLAAVSESDARHQTQLVVAVAGSRVRDIEWSAVTVRLHRSERGDLVPAERRRDATAERARLLSYDDHLSEVRRAMDEQAAAGPRVARPRFAPAGVVSETEHPVPIWPLTQALRAPVDLAEFKQLHSRYLQIQVQLADQVAARGFVRHSYALFPRYGAGSIREDAWISARLGCVDAEDAIEQAKRIVTAIADRGIEGERPLTAEVQRNRKAGELTDFGHSVAQDDRERLLAYTEPIIAASAAHSPRAA